MSPSLRRDALAILLGIGASLGAIAQTQAPPPAAANGARQAAAASSPASGPAATKQKRASRAKTPPGKPPRGAAACNQADKAERQRCLNDLYGAGGPRI